MNETIVQNKRARLDYQILETFDAGMVLSGQEVKSIKTNGISLIGAYVIIRENGEARLIGARVAPYAKAGRLPGYDPEQSRKLLLRKRELRYLMGKTRVKGLTLIPLKVYAKRGLIKLEFGLARGKKKYEKRETIKRREIERRMEEALKVSARGRGRET